LDKNQARDLIRETFEQPFDKARFVRFIKELLNHIEEDLIPRRQGQFIPEAYRKYISTFERIGKFNDGEKRVDILIVKLLKTTSLEQARTSQRNFIAGYLQGKYGSSKEKDAALVAFVSPDTTDWRFSLVRLDYIFDGKGKVREEFTPARRWSFLVGAGEKSHTAQSRLVKILAEDDEDPTLAELEDAFDIETVTREFFLEYRNLFIRTKEALDEVVKIDSKVKADFDTKGVNTVDFAKKLLGQIVFLYFLQKKGWFGVGRNAAWGTGSKQFLREIFERKHGGYANFFNDILEPLFYEALRIDRRHDDDYYKLFNCKIPFLNGGLFDPIGSHGGYDWVHTDINLPDSLFSNKKKTKKGDEGDGILDVFDRYNFTVKEDEPLEKEVAIDPELLGKAYEKFNAIRPDNFDEYKKALKSGKKGDESKFNKQFGVYYTPREIVHYMCRESLIEYLVTEMNKGSAGYERLGDRNLDMFGNQGKKGQLDIIAPHGGDRKVSREDIEALIHIGEHLGENEEIALLKARRINDGRQKTSVYTPKLDKSIGLNAELIDRKLEDITVCDPAVGSGAFPVGMMNEIIKTRMALNKYVADKDDRTAYDFKRRCIEHSLYGVDIDPGAVEIAKLRLWLSLVVDEDDIKTIKPLPNLDYKIVRGNSLVGLPSYALKDLELESKIEKLKIAYFKETNPTNKKEMKDGIDQAFKTLVQNAKKYSSNVLDTDFDFKIHFSEVFHEKDGFDMVIGNPPYIRQEQIKEYKSWFKTVYKECYAGAADIYVYFYEKGLLDLLREEGILTFITSNKYMRAGYGAGLRQLLSSFATIEQLIDFGDASVFDAASYPSIILLRKKRPDNGRIRALSWERSTPISEFEKAFQAYNILILQKELTADGWRIEAPAVLRLLEKLRKAGTPLGEYVNGRFYRGILTGSNEAFVVGRATRDRLISEHSSSEDVLKPFLRGRDVKRWRVEPQDLWLVFIPWHFPLQEDKSITGPSKEAEKAFQKQYPAIYRHLLSFKKPLSMRNAAETGVRYEWYALQRWGAGYWREFDWPKIVVPAISNNVEYAVDRSSFFSNDKTSICVAENADVLTGMLNSNLLWWFIRQIAAAKQNGFYEFKPMYVSQIPIATGPEMDHIQKNVDQIFTATEKNPAANISDREAEINRLVYDLYGLTKDEIRIVEEGAGNGKL